MTPKVIAESVTGESTGEKEEDLIPIKQTARAECILQNANVGNLIPGAIVLGAGPLGSYLGQEGSVS